MSRSIVPEVVYIASREWAQAFRENAGPDAPFFESLPRFPDGSLIIQGKEAIKEYFGILGVGPNPARERNVALGERLHAFGAAPPNGFDFRSLAPYPPRVYGISYSAKYQKRLGGDYPMHVHPHLEHTARPDECQLANLGVQVDFRRMLAKEASAFLDALAGWAASTRAGNVLGEGPSNIASTTIRIEGTRATFAIDVSKAGQQSVNWLVLSMINFGMDHVPVTDVAFAGHGAHVPLKRTSSILEVEFPPPVTS